MGNIKERDNFEVTGRRWEDNIKLYWTVGIEQIYLTQDRDRWRALAKTEINYRTLYYVGKFLTS